MPQRKTSTSNPQLPPNKADGATLGLSIEMQAERGGTVESPIRERCVIVHETSKNRYDTTNVSGNANAILGDVTNHNYFYGGKVPYLAGLQVHQEGCTIDPDTISDYDYCYAHWLRSEQRLKHTCEWIFKRTAYKRWANSTGPPILVVSGSVGSGKSITASAVIDQLTLQQRDTELVVSYFVDHAREQATTCIEILRALVKQILHKISNDKIVKDLEPSLRAVFPSAQARPSAKAISGLLSKSILKVKSCVFVIDGLDALPEGEIDEFLDILREFFPSIKSKEIYQRLIVFCRHSLSRGIRLESIPLSARCEIRLKNIQRDLFAFVDHEVDFRQGRRSITDCPNLIEEMKRVLKAHCGKMFLWIRLQIMSLWDPGLINCDDDIRQQLSSLPEGLDEIYIRCLRRIEHTYNKSSREIAPKLFKWVACANEPLTQLQAREAVSITPENIPLRKSQTLNTPAEDHCANLVTLDEISGRVVFPHPSVRDFLRDPLKVPEDLHHYLLSAGRDELWCGELCLAYAHYLHTRKQIVPYKTTHLQESIPSLFVKDVPGAWLSSLLRKPRPNQGFRMPLPTSVHSVEHLQDSYLHGYMRRNWLSHNRRISRGAPNYLTFTTLCLGQDPQLQPWATERATGLEHYHRLFEFAIMTNNAPLFEVAADYVKHGKAGIPSLEDFFMANCPGTDSSWLHVCAALGHKEVMHLILPLCSKWIVSHGKSAAVLALEHKNFDLFGLLIPDPLPEPVWTLSNDRSVIMFRENLLRACATYGDTTAIDTLLHRLQEAPSRGYLSDALLHAWKHNSREVVEVIINAGAPMTYLYLIEQDKEYYKSHFSLDSSVIPTLLIASRLENAQVWNTIWTASVSAWKWLDIIMLETKFAFSRDLFRTWSSISRKLLTAVEASQVLPYLPPDGPHTAAGDLHNHPMLGWLKRVPDDVLVGVLRNNLIRIHHMFEPELIIRLANRWSSRGLEAWVESLGIERSLCRWQAGDTSVRTRLSSVLEQVLRGYGLPSFSPDYSALLLALSHQATREGRTQVVDFFACYEFADERGATFGREKRELQVMLPAWDVARFSGSTLPATLTWLRLHNMDGGNQAKKDTVWKQRCKDKPKCIDGNLALNYPAGYDVVGQNLDGGRSSYPAASTAIGQPVKRCIIEALYRWNHRLQSKNKRLEKTGSVRLSDAERWYTLDRHYDRSISMFGTGRGSRRNLRVLSTIVEGV